MTTEPVINKYGEVCDDEAIEIARDIGEKVGDYFERMLKEGRISLTETYALAHYFAVQIDFVAVMRRLTKRCDIVKRCK